MGERYRTGFRCESNRKHFSDSMVCRKECRFDETVFRRVESGAGKILKESEHLEVNG